MNTAHYEHKMAAHCETGTVAGILNHKGLSISEPMVFGISGGIFFAYLKSPKFAFPMFVPRSKPGDIRKKVQKRLKVSYKEKKFSNPHKANTTLNELLKQNIPVATQVDMFYMDYIPKYMKVHFNGHFITVVGRENGVYTVSDCYYPSLVELRSDSMEKARFAKGDLAPKGLLFYFTHVPSDSDLKTPIVAGITEACRNMIKLPVPFIGVKGIRLFGRKVVEWPKIARDEEHLSHEIMKISVGLEDRGTGGAGFRFMYATFLQEASRLLDSRDLADMSKKMMAIGDNWREISLYSARIGKNLDLGPESLKKLGEMIMARADEEEQFFTQLLKIIKGY